MDCRYREHFKGVTSRILRGCCTGTLLVILASGAAAAPVPVYTVQDLGTLPGHIGFSEALAINDRGQVVGEFTLAPTRWGRWLGHLAFLWEPGSGMTDLVGEPPDTYAFGINDSGQVVGLSGSADPSGVSAFLWENGSGTDLGELLPTGSGSSVAWAINNSGQVVGSYINGGQWRAFLLDADGRMTDLGDLITGSVSSEAYAINDNGEVVGEWRDGSTDRAFLVDADGRVTDLGNGRATGINDHGQVVGTSGSGAFLWEAGSGRTDLGTLPGGSDFSKSYASGINNSGQVVGNSPGGGAFLWEADLGMLELDTLIDPLDPLYGIELYVARAINSSGQIAAIGPGSDGRSRSFLLTPQLTPKSRAFLHCSRDLTDDGTVGIAVVTRDQVTIKALDGTLINQFALNGLDDLTDTELMPDTNGNGAPELVALSRSAARAVVRDLLSGADLGTIQYSADLAPIALELGDDPTGNGIPDLASLGDDPAQVEVRDALTGGLISDVGFSGYVTGKDLTVYPDLDGSGALALAVLAENRRPDRADKIEIRNASSGAMIRQIWLGKDWLVLEQERIGDLNGNGSEEIAVLQKEPQYSGSVRVQIRDIGTSGWVNFVGFANKYPPQSLVVIPDLDGNGADELAVFGRHLDGLNQKAVIKDAKTGKQLNQLWFDRDFPGQDFVSCGDTNGNGSADVALLGQRPEDGQLQVMVQDARTGERLAFVWF